MSRPAPGRLELVRGFLNTVSVSRRTDELADVAGYRRWLRQANLPVSADINDGYRVQAVALRQALRVLVATHDDANPPDRAELIAVRAALQGLTLQLSVDERGAIELVPASDRPGQTASASLLSLVAKASAIGTWQRLKLCRLLTCRWAFYDASPARAAVWCNMAVCGARHKARAYRQRQAENA